MGMIEINPDPTGKFLIVPKRIVGYDKEWLLHFDELIQTQLDNSTLTSFDISKQMLGSRVQLFRKVKSLTGLPPMKYLKRARLSKAITYINQFKCRTVKDLAHRVGFRDVKYFSKQFKEFYGRLPSRLIKEKYN